ncbi:MAG: hypothetical protein ACFFG0_42950, partial [Candidatus Thorarchaeota archaeon]
MSTHPLSLYKQILFSFPEVKDARIEYLNYSIIIYLKLIDDIDTNAVVSKIKHYIDEHRGICDQYIVKTKWIDGPKYPVIFNKLDMYEFSLIESCSGTVDEIERLLYKVYEFIKKLYIRTISAGVVGIEILPIDDYEITKQELNRLQLFCELLFPPGVKVVITTTRKEKTVNYKKN